MLRRILGLGFGLALVFGGTMGVGILRLPGTLATALGDSKLIVVFWILGGAYALLGAVSVAELAAMLPQAGGFDKLITDLAVAQSSGRSRRAVSVQALLAHQSAPSAAILAIPARR